MMENLHEFMAQIGGELGSIRAEVRGLRDDIRQTKGFIGGVMWCLGGLAAGVGFIWGLFSS